MDERGRASALRVKSDNNVEMDEDVSISRADHGTGAWVWVEFEDAR